MFGQLFIEIEFKSGVYLVSLADLFVFLMTVFLEPVIGLTFGRESIQFDVFVRLAVMMVEFELFNFEDYFLILHGYFIAGIIIIK